MVRATWAFEPPPRASHRSPLNAAFTQPTPAVSLLASDDFTSRRYASLEVEVKRSNTTPFL